jgi:hypothetical protein
MNRGASFILGLFGDTMWKLFIIKPFSNQNKLKLKPILEFGGILGVVEKLLTS